ncbi:hypothetical protein T492DRAFT_855637, partial [Pavlovales sp. CCMP2436]
SRPVGVLTGVRALDAETLATSAAAAMLLYPAPEQLNLPLSGRPPAVWLPLSMRPSTAGSERAGKDDTKDAGSEQQSGNEGSEDSFGGGYGAGHTPRQAKTRDNAKDSAKENLKDNAKDNAGSERWKETQRQEGEEEGDAAEHMPRLPLLSVGTDGCISVWDVFAGVCSMRLPSGHDAHEPLIGIATDEKNEIL